MRAAMFMVSPNTQYFGIAYPTTPVYTATILQHERGSGEKKVLVTFKNFSSKQNITRPFVVHINRVQQ